MKGKQQHDPHGSQPQDAATQSDEGRSASVVATAAGEDVPSAATVDAGPELQTKVEKLEDSLLRARADLQNAQRRASADRLDAVRYANAELMKSLVQVVDDFERALSTADRTKESRAFFEGMQLVYQNLTKALAEHGLETVDAMNQPFDPALHEALMQKPTAQHPAGTVIEQAAKGYRLRDRVIRPARVVVAKPADGGSEIEGGQ